MSPLRLMPSLDLGMSQGSPLELFYFVLPAPDLEKPLGAF